MSEQNSNNTNQTITSTSLTYDNCINYIVQCKQEGKGSRKIAKELGLGSKSTVNHWYAKYLKGGGVEVKKSGPKILIFDIEYFPAKVMCYGRYKQFIVQDFVLEEGYMASFAAKWLNEDNIVAFNLPYYSDVYKGAWDTNDIELVKDLHKLLDEADMVVAHNLKGYDWKQMNTRFVFHGLYPISPTKLIDTLDICRKNFRFPDNKLNTVANYLGLGSKTADSGASMWRECMEGNGSAWKHELEYNIQDINLLEQMYLILRPFDNRHPSVAPYYNDGKMHCTCCGSTDLEITDKKSYTSLSEFNVYQCKDCGKHSRSRKNVREKEDLNNTLMNSL